MSFEEWCAEVNKLSAQEPHRYGPNAVENCGAAGDAGAMRDDPMMDATDFAHPAWWRGVDYAYVEMCAEIGRILDGEPVRGVCSEPWESVRRRVGAMREAPDGWVTVPREPTEAMLRKAGVIGAEGVMPRLGIDRGARHFLKQWGAMLRNAPLPPSAGGWRDMASAPRDGTPILIACARTQSIRWAVWSGGMWRDGQVEAGGRVSGCPAPTHWMPLPAPPAPQGGEVGRG